MRVDLNRELPMPFALDTLDAVQRKLDEYAACQCCDTHTEPVQGAPLTCNKPTKWAPWVELPHHYTQCGECKCPCRHNARILCRMHPDCKTPVSLEPAMQRHADRLLTEVFIPRTARPPPQGNFRRLEDLHTLGAPGLALPEEGLDAMGRVAHAMEQRLMSSSDLRSCPVSPDSYD